MSKNLEFELKNQIPELYKSAIKISEQTAEELHCNIYLIGGIVRDLILNNTIKDIDIAVQADAVMFAKRLEKKYGCKILKIQENLRTASVEFKSGCVIDFASTREELYKAPGMLPVAHNFGCDLKSDVQRRDFTINTLAISLNGAEKYNLIDFYNGYDDIKNKKIRILHNNSFIDDPSRIVRALKFMVRLNFSIEENTIKLLNEYLSNPCRNIPIERIKNEFLQYFSIKKDNTFDIALDFGVFKLLSDNPPLTVNIKVLDNLKLFNLFDDDEINEILLLCLLLNSDYNSLSLTSQEKKILIEVKELLNNAEHSFSDDFKIYKLFNKKLNKSLIIYYLITKDENLIKYLNKLKNITVEINGNDLIELGYKPSGYFTVVFDEILKEKIKGNITTKQEEINFAKFIKEKRNI